MAYWPRIVREHPFLSLLGIALASLAVLSVSVWFGPVAGLVAIVFAVGFVTFYAWHRGSREARARARAEADTFSFADVVLRMRAKDRAEALVAIQRREEILGAR